MPQPKQSSKGRSLPVVALSVLAACAGKDGAAPTPAGGPDDTALPASDDTGLNRGPCAILSDRLPDGLQAEDYLAEIAVEGEGCATATWSAGDCCLPPGLSLEAGALSGKPAYGGPFPVDLTLTGPDGATLDQVSLWLWVEGVMDTLADLDRDGDVDEDDLAVLDAEYTGPAERALSVADGSVRSGANADTNFNRTLGDIVPVELDNAPADPGDDNWKGYLKFDVSALTGGESVALSLYTDASYGGPVPADLRLDVFGLLDGQDDWDEESLTWNNAPANVDNSLDLVGAEVYGGAPLGSFTTTGAHDLFSAEALDRFVAEEAGADGLVTLVLIVESDTAADGDYTVFSSHEAAGLEPALVIGGGAELRADLDEDGDVDDDDQALLLQSWTGPLDPSDLDLCWSRYVTRAADVLIEVGTDHYGEVESDLLMAVIDLESLEAPERPAGEDPCPGEDITAQPAGYPPDACMRTEGRAEHGRLSLGGSNLWMDQPLLKTLWRLSEQTGEPRYADAADADVAATFAYATSDVPATDDDPANRTIWWGSHSYYDAYADAPGGELWYGGPLVGDPIHEILITQPDWAALYAIDPDAVRDEVQSIWDWHVVDHDTGLHNRHNGTTGGVLDFAYSGGSFTLAFASLYALTGEAEWLERAELLVQHHKDAVEPSTGLVPDAPNSAGRFDSEHMMTSVSGPYVAQLLRAYALTGDELFREAAIGYVLAYDAYGWDPDEGSYYGMLQLDGTPQTESLGAGYGEWAPVGHVNIWRTAQYSYEFALTAAEASVYAHSLAEPEDKAALLQVGERWAQVIEASLPARPGNRFGDILTADLPEVAVTRGTYAENYGRAISFFVNLYLASCETRCEEPHLSRARLLAHEAVEKLWHPSGLFRGHPAKDTYQSNDGVGFLLHALLELDALPERWQPAF